MASAKGARPPNAGKGRTKGTPNKLTADLKEMILGALADAGGRAYLAKQADANPAAFMTLIGKVLPMQVAMDATFRLADVSDQPIPEDEWHNLTPAQIGHA